MDGISGSENNYFNPSPGIFHDILLLYTLGTYSNNVSLTSVPYNSNTHNMGIFEGKEAYCKNAF